MGAPDPEPSMPPSIPSVPVPSPRAPTELDLPDELAWQRYRVIATPNKHIVRLVPKNIAEKASRLFSDSNFLIAGIIYLVAGLLYSGSPFRSTGERQYLTNMVDERKAVEELANAMKAFKAAEAESYNRLTQVCLGVPLMKITAEEMNDSIFAWLQEIVHPLSIPVYDACLAFKRGSHLLNYCSNLQEASSFFREFLKLAKTIPDSSTFLNEHQRRLDVDRSQETVRHANIAPDFIFDYARAVKQFLRPNFFAWWLCLASQSLVHYGIKKRYKRISRELNQYLYYVNHLVALLDNSISKLIKPLGPMKPLYEKLLFEFHLEAATALVNASDILLLCRKKRESQKKLVESLNFLERGVKSAQEQGKLDWNARFRIAQVILQLRRGKLKAAEEALRVRSKALREHNGIKAMQKLLLEIKKKGKSSKSTTNSVLRSIEKNLEIQPLDWDTYNWTIYLDDFTSK